MNLDSEIKKQSIKLKKLIAQKQGLTLEQFEYRKKEKDFISINRKRRRIDNSRFKGLVFKFKCPNCHSLDTKRTGRTFQAEPKGRFLCNECQYKRIIKKDDRIRPFFVLSNEEMSKQINDSKLSKEEKEKFLLKYLIKIR